MIIHPTPGEELKNALWPAGASEWKDPSPEVLFFQWASMCWQYNIEPGAILEQYVLPN